MKKKPKKKTESFAPRFRIGEVVFATIHKTRENDSFIYYGSIKSAIRRGNTWCYHVENHPLTQSIAESDLLASSEKIA
jgi:hypothetical protein